MKTIKTIECELFENTLNICYFEQTLFSKLCDQFMLKRNYTKSTLRLSVQILSKITIVTMLECNVW